MKITKLFIFVILIYTSLINAQQIYINEILSTGSPDWVELYNPNNFDVDLSGWHTWDPSTVGSHYILPPLTIIPAKGFLVLFCDDGNNGLHTNYKLSSGGETVWIGNTTGVVVDSVIFPALTSGTSYGRNPDGSPIFEIFTNPSQGASNSTVINNPPTIENPTRIPFYPTSNDIVYIYANVTDDSGLNPEVKLYFDDGTGWQSTIMQLEQAPHYFARIIYKPVGTVVKYYIEAIDNLNSISTNPTNAPLSYYSYTVLENPYIPPKVYVNEIVASNISIITDPDFGAYADYIELYNGETNPVDLSNWYMTDNLSNPTKWQFPANSIIQAKSFLLIWADSKNSVLNGIHTNFALSKNGEAVGLYNSDAYMIDTVTFPSLPDNNAYQRNGEEQSTWIITDMVTPGLPNTIIQVSVEKIDLIVNNFYLSQNYPNPFNPSTKIRFSVIDNSSKTTLKVYDILGNLVETLVNDNLAKGTYEVNFNANNLSSGVYFYTLNNGKNISTKKMTLIK